MDIGSIKLGVWIAVVVSVAVILSLAVWLLLWLDKQSAAGWKKWYERINDFPSTKALVLLGIISFVSTGMVVALTAAYFAWTSKVPSLEFVHALDVWMDKVLIVMGIATGHFALKRATTKVELEKPEVSNGT